MIYFYVQHEWRPLRIILQSQLNRLNENTGNFIVKLMDFRNAD